MKNDGSILVCDINKGLVTALLLLLQKEFRKVKAETGKDKIIQLVKENDIDILILDGGQNWNETDNKLADYIKKLINIDPFLQIVLLTNFSQNRQGLDAVEAGAFDFISKPWNNEKLLVTLRNAYKMRQQMVALKQINAVKEYFKSENQFFWGVSNASKGIFEAARKHSQRNEPLLISGQKGSGKELLALQIHSLGSRSDFAFIKMDASGLSDQEFERNLTLARGGTLYIENIEALDISKQMLLIKCINKVNNKDLNGIISSITDIRIIVGSERKPADLKRDSLLLDETAEILVKNNLKLPPLNERKEDIVPMATLFLNKYNKKYRKHIKGFSELAKEILEENQWAGNTSELSLTVERAVIIAPDGGQILPGHIMLDGESPEIAKNSINTLTLEQMEGKMMRAALKRNNGNVTLAAEQLGITRQTMYNKGKKHKLFK